MDFLRDFEEKVNEINQYFEFILIIDNISKLSDLPLKNHPVTIKGQRRFLLKKTVVNKEYLVTSELRKTLKATSFLLLYNLIEGSLTAAINQYFNSFSSKNEKYKNLKPAVKKIWLNYRYKMFKKNNLEVVDVIEQIFEDIVNIQPKEITSEGTTRLIFDYSAYNAEIGNTDFSGNIDARKIRDLSSKYGFAVPKVCECASLLTIKSNRNKLAHGEASFSVVGRERTIEQLLEIKNESILFLRSVLKAIEKSIVTENYLTKTKRIAKTA